MSSHILQENVAVNSFDMDYMTEELKRRAETELFEDENIRTQCLLELRSLLKEEENISFQDDDLFLLTFLRARKYDVKRAFSILKGLYGIFSKHSDIYYNLTCDRLKVIMEENSSAFLSHRNHDNSVVLYFHFGNWNPDNISAKEHLITVSIGILQALQSPATQIAGFHVIADFKCISLKHFMNVPVSFLLLMAEIVQNSVPMRLKGYHIVNQNYFYTQLWHMGKRFLTKKIRERFHVHGSDYQSLHKFVDPRILPAELDGDQPPFNNAEWQTNMEASFGYINHVLSFGYKKNLKEKRKKFLENRTEITAP